MSREQTQPQIQPQNDPHQICPACGGVNTPEAFFCANPRCRKALGGRKYAPEEVKKETRWHERVADGVVSWIGKPQFLGAHLLWFLGWTLINTGVLGVLVMTPRFDAPPFALLGILLSMETIFITGFVLISQNRQSKYDAKRAELDYEANVETFRRIAAMEATLARILARLDARDGAG